MTAFNKILIANRGEIAVRVMRTAKTLGYGTVAVYSEADRDALHVAVADEAVCIGPAPVGESYLVADKIIEAARLSGAEAVHPGYGFLSENAGFAKACDEAGLVFIGPGTEAIDLMGNKRASKIAMLKAGVPCVPGYEGEDQSDARMIEEAKLVGLPVMVKAAAGGGGRGMRLVSEESELENAIRSARSEAESAFGSGELILEKAVIQPRHVEIQVIADQQGNTLYLGERDCSIQRRHQKVIEESPSPVVTEEIRKSMGEAAVNAAKACNYVGAGTVEFLLDSRGEFYFLEMNTRLQVEHPVTEMVTGVDLVEWQINIASGDSLPLTQDEVTLTGHAIEARLYAEDPANEFLPQTGEVLCWKLPEGVDVRVDHGVREGQVISPHYDPMVAKVIVHGENRAQAIRKLYAAMKQVVLLGVNSNQQFLANLCLNPVFKEGGATTAFIQDHFSNDCSMVQTPPDNEQLLLAGILFFLRSGQQLGNTIGWSSSNDTASTLKLAWGDNNYQVQISRLREESPIDGFQVKLFSKKEKTWESLGDETVAVAEITGDELVYEFQSVQKRIYYAVSDNRVYLRSGNGNLVFNNVTNEPPNVAGGAGSGKVTAPMDGAIVEVMVKEGDVVEVGQLLVVMEAMKMEHQLKSDVNGTVANIGVSSGAQVKGRQLLVEVEPEPEAETEGE